MRTLTDDQRRALLVERQLVGAPGRERRSVLDVAHSVGPLHSTDPSTAYLQIAARSGVSVDEIATAFYEERALLRHTTLRRTVHLLTPDLAVAAHGAYNHRIVPKLRAQLIGWLATSEDVDGDPATWLARVEELVMAARGRNGLDVRRATEATLHQRDGHTAGSLGADLPRVPVDLGEGDAFEDRRHDDRVLGDVRRSVFGGGVARVGVFLERIVDGGVFAVRRVFADRGIFVDRGVLGRRPIRVDGRIGLSSVVPAVGATGGPAYETERERDQGAAGHASTGSSSSMTPPMSSPLGGQATFRSQRAFRSWNPAANAASSRPALRGIPGSTRPSRTAAPFGTDAPRGREIQTAKMRRIQPFVSTTLALLLVASGVGCGDDAADDPEVVVDPNALVLNPLDAIPETMAEVGLYPLAPDLSVVAPVAHLYEPASPLWSSGSDKTRYVVIPDGGQVDNSGELWSYPTGTLFFKTFTFWDADGVQRPYETRLMRRTEDGWDFVTYVWNEDGTDAVASDMRRPIRVDVFTEDGTPVNHAIPSLLQCRKCHESSQVGALGFSEIQLSEAGSDGEPQLARLHAAGLFAAAPPAEPDRVTHPDALTEEFLRYLQGNCVHCHNGWDDGANSSYDLRYGAALDNLINRETESSVSAVGVRVIPGNPEESILFEAVSRITDEQDIEFMPPVGIDLVDPYAVDLIRRWIESLPNE